MDNPRAYPQVIRTEITFYFNTIGGSISSNCLGRGVDSWGHIWTVMRVGHHICLPRKVMTQVPAFAILGLDSVSFMFSYSPDIL